MSKRRLIFSLLYNDGFFYLSRNFSLQKIGNIDWLEKNYGFSRVSCFIDELVILNVGKKNQDNAEWLSTIERLAKNNFVPICAGGGVNDLNDAHTLFSAGADKIAVNSLLHKQGNELEKIAEAYGQQSIVGSLDLLEEPGGGYKIFSRGLNEPTILSFDSLRLLYSNRQVGEFLVKSIDRDGTGMGLDLDLARLFLVQTDVPIILSGGVGNFNHIDAAFSNTEIKAVCTANLLNFVGDGLENVRMQLSEKYGNEIAKW